MMTQRWFHPLPCPLDAEILLLERGHDGYFLVRPIITVIGDFALSVRRGNYVKHVKIQFNGEYFDLYGGEKFKTLPELIQYYMEYPMFETNGNVIQLVTPLHRDDPSTECWYHGRLTAKESERIMLESGTDGSFLVREVSQQKQNNPSLLFSSASRPGDFILSVRKKDQVKHVKLNRKNGKYHIEGGKHFDDLVSLVEFYRKYSMLEYNDEILRLREPVNATRIKVAHFHKRVMQLEHNDCNGFWEEFKTLQMMENLRLFDRMDKESAPEVIRKIRNKGIRNKIKRFEYTRIILTDIRPTAPLEPDNINVKFVGSSPDDTNSKNNGSPAIIIPEEKNPLKAQRNGADNLSPHLEPSVFRSNSSNINTMRPKPAEDIDKVPELVYDKLYIASQGCLSNSIYEFWAMIWQENVCIIITTKEIERGKDKYDIYWPDINKTEVIKVYTVFHESEWSASDYTVRRLIVAKEDEPGVKRTIYHFHFTAWPDHGVPSEPSRVLNILLDVNYRLQEIMTGQNAPPQAVVCVHCSAGIGRTGTFIVIDMILDQIRKEGLDCEIDIHRTVQMVRDYHSGMVQDELQYMFIYETVLECIKTENQGVPFGVNSKQVLRPRHCSPRHCSPLPVPDTFLGPKLN